MIFNKKTFKRWGSLGLSASLLCGIFTYRFLGNTEVKAAENGKVKNVIMLIPDGMSTSTTTLTRWYKDIQDGTLGNDKLAMDEIASGYVKTNWLGGPITDSAPGGTAYSTGKKTNNKYVGVDSNKVPMATIVEAAKLSGKATGIIATSEIMHATPADFSAHYADRGNYNAIMKQQVYNGMDVVLGGGDAFFSTSGGGSRKDGKDLKAEIKGLGYDYVTTKQAMSSSTSNKLWGMFSSKAMAYDIDRAEAAKEEPSLTEMTKKAIDVLSKDKEGFFLMVEGSKIDWAAHANDPAGMITDTLAFDAAVKEALEFAKRDNNTAVIVATDHGNSGITIGNESTNSGYDNLSFEDSIKKLNTIKASAERFLSLIKGKSDDEIKSLVKTYYGISDLSADELTKIKSNLNDSKATDSLIKQIISSRAKLGFTTTGHTGGDVQLYAYAPGSVKQLSGTIDNTDVGKYMAEVLGLDLNKTTAQLFNNVNDLFGSQGAEITVDNTDAENPVVNIKKDQTLMKLYANTNIAEVNGESFALDGVVVYNGKDTFASKKVLDLMSSNKNTLDAGNNKLPKTGSFIDLDLLVGVGITITALGVVLMVRMKKRKVS